jgi:methylated-DNA-[protein]-cysteine S-methyltransferase
MSGAFARMPSPIGELLLAGDADELWGVWVDGQRWAPLIAPAWRESPGLFAEARRQLEAYFAGERTAFELPLRLRGTPFQLQVWTALTAIPHGQTRTYRELATSLGRPAAARAVGAANGRNPFCIVVPCHRLVGAGGGLVDYAAGLDAKRWLLDHEARRPRQAGE